VRLPRGTARLVGFAVACVLACVVDASAQSRFVKPWTPPDSDTLLTWATEARARFRANQGDSITGENFRAYQSVANAGRWLLRSMGRENIGQAHAIEPILDSLGLDTDVVVDPSLPQFVLLMVRNPFRLTANAAGYVMWYVGDDLRIQGALFEGGLSPKMRVWWTGRSDAPYSLAVVDQERGGEMHLLFICLSADGYYFNLVQYGNSSPRLGGPGDATFTDVNGDGIPEVVAWVKLVPDSTFLPCDQCPPLISEVTYVERAHGFQLHDVRLLPSPFSTFTHFIRLLMSQEYDGARRLLDDPSKLEEAIDRGWTQRGNGLWTVVAREEGESWPEWFDLRFNGEHGVQHVRLRFVQLGGRWIISRWEPTPRLGQPGTERGGR